MSHSTLLDVYKTRANWEVELHNSWGTGPIMWDFFYEKHCWNGRGWKEDLYGQGGATYFLRPFAVYHDSSNMSLLFSKLKDVTVPLHHRAGLLLTADRAVLRSEDLTKLVEPFALLAAELRGYSKPGYSNHWEAIARYVSEKAQAHDPRLLGIALDCTSVSDVWDDYPDSLGIKCTSEILFEIPTTKEMSNE